MTSSEINLFITSHEWLLNQKEEVEENILVDFLQMHLDSKKKRYEELFKKVCLPQQVNNNIENEEMEIMKNDLQAKLNPIIEIMKKFDKENNMDIDELRKNFLQLYKKLDKLIKNPKNEKNRQISINKNFKNFGFHQ